MASAQAVHFASSGYRSLPAFSRYHAEVYSFCYNQAVLASLKTFTAAVYGERRYLMKELGQYSISLALPVPSGSFGIQTDYFGNASYHETQCGLAYGRKLGGHVALGIQFNYLSTS